MTRQATFTMNHNANQSGLLFKEVPAVRTRENLVTKRLRKLGFEEAADAMATSNLGEIEQIERRNEIIEQRRKVIREAIIAVMNRPGFVPRYVVIDEVKGFFIKRKFPIRCVDGKKSYLPKFSCGRSIIRREFNSFVNEYSERFEIKFETDGTNTEVLYKMVA